MNIKSLFSSIVYKILSGYAQQQSGARAKMHKPKSETYPAYSGSAPAVRIVETGSYVKIDLTLTFFVSIYKLNNFTYASKDTIAR